MRVLILLVAVATLAISCGPTNYKVEELIGKWQGEKYAMTFNEDNTCEILIDGEQYPAAEWRAAIGNTLEFTQAGKVTLSNVTIKSLKDDVLTIEMRPIMTKKDLTTEIHMMNRVK